MNRRSGGALCWSKEARGRIGHRELTKTEREARGGRRRHGRSGELFSGEEVEDDVVEVMV